MTMTFIKAKVIICSDLLDKILLGYHHDIASFDSYCDISHERYSIFALIFCFNVGLDDLDLYQGQSCHLGRIT